jgi:hypothetical protein
MTLWSINSNIAEYYCQEISFRHRNVIVIRLEIYQTYQANTCLCNRPRKKDTCVTKKVRNCELARHMTLMKRKWPRMKIYFYLRSFQLNSVAAEIWHWVFPCRPRSSRGTLWTLGLGFLQEMEGYNVLGHPIEHELPSIELVLWGLRLSSRCKMLNSCTMK